MMSQACNKVPPIVRKAAIEVAEDAVVLGKKLKMAKPLPMPAPKPNPVPTPPSQANSESSKLTGKIFKKVTKEWWSKEDKEEDEGKNEVVRNSRIPNAYSFPEK